MSSRPDAEPGGTLLHLRQPGSHSAVALVVTYLRLASRALAAILAGPRTPGKTTDIGAAGQPIEAGLLLAARARGIEIRRTVAPATMTAESRAAVGTAMAPYARPWAGSAVAMAAMPALAVPGADPGAAGRAPIARTTHQTRPAGMVRAGVTGASLGHAVMRGSRVLTMEKHDDEGTRPTESSQYTTPRSLGRQGSRPGIESSRIHHRLAYCVTTICINSVC